MALNLRKKGFEVIVHNRSRPSVDALVAAGARAVGSPAEVARSARVIMTTDPDPTFANSCCSIMRSATRHSGR